VRTHQFEDVLVRTASGGRGRSSARRPRPARSSESVLAGYFSMSWSAPHLFGDGLEEFAADVWKLLASRSPTGIFWHWPGDAAVILARG
jgi:hypothetical protein